MLIGLRIIMVDMCHRSIQKILSFFVVEQSFEQIFNVRDNSDDKQSF